MLINAKETTCKDDDELLSPLQVIFICTEQRGVGEEHATAAGENKKRRQKNSNTYSTMNEMQRNDAQSELLELVPQLFLKWQMNIVSRLTIVRCIFRKNTTGKA